MKQAIYIVVDALDGQVVTAFISKELAVEYISRAMNEAGEPYVYQEVHLHHNLPWNSF